MTKKKTTLYLDPELLAKALEAAGTKVITEAVHLGLEALVRKAAYQRMRELLGSEKGRPIYDVPRRRAPATRSIAHKRNAKKSA